MTKTMKLTKKYILSFLMCICTLVIVTSCDEDPGDALKAIIKDDLGYVPRIAGFTLVQPGTTTVPAGQNIVLDLRFWSEGQIKDIQFYRIDGATETKIGEQAYAPAYSKVTRTDSLRFTYQMPADLESGATYSIQARVTNTGLEQYPTKSALLNLKVE
jgi:hypothetical protein